MDFTAVIRKLGLWREDAVACLRDPSAHAEALALKCELDSAIAALELFRRFQIRPDAPVMVLPNLRTMTPSCAYRVVEDAQTDDRTQWVELEMEGRHLELSPGDIIIEQGRWPLRARQARLSNIHAGDPTDARGSPGKAENKRKGGELILNNVSPKVYMSPVLLCLVSLAFAAGSAVAQGTALGGSQAQEANTVTIISTQYGVSPEYRITVTPSGQITSTLQPRHQRKAIVREDQLTAFNRQQFFRDLARASPLNALPIGTGPRAMAGRPGRRGSNTRPAPMVNLPGPQIYVQYHRQQTPNLRIAGSSTGKMLYEDVTKIMEKLRMPIPNYP